MTLELAVREAASILAPAVKDADNKASRDIFGTAIVSASGAKVMLDGAASPVGCSFSVNCLDGDRVVCHIVNHRVVVFSNITNPDLSTAEVISHVKDNPNTGVIQNVVVSDSTLQDIDLHGFMATDGTIENTKISGGSIDGATLTNIPYAAIDELDAHSADIADARIGQATITQAQVENLVADKATINGKLTAAEGNISQLQANTADIGTIRANAAKVQNLTAEQLEADHAKVGTLDSDYAQINLANVNNAYIKNGVFDKAAVFDAAVFDLTGDTATLKEINADNITVRNLHTKNLTVDTADGYVTIGSKKTPTKEFIDSLKDELQQEIDGAVETWTSTAVPLLNNYPASQWADDNTRAKHVGDICYVQKTGDEHDGFCYRFSYDSTSQQFSWVLIKDSSVTKALGDISDLKTFQSDTETWIEETDEGLTTIRENHTALSGVVNGVKATADAALPASTFTQFESTTFKTVKDTVDEQSSTIAQMSETVRYGGKNLLPLTGEAGGYYQTTVPSGTRMVEVQDEGTCFARSSEITAGAQIVFSSNASTEAMKSGERYTLSLMVKTSAARSFALQLRKNNDGADGGNFQTQDPVSVTADTWAQLTLSFTASASRSVYARLYAPAGTEATVHVRHLKLERGSIATPWDYASEDVTTLTNTVNSVKQTATANVAKISSLTATLGTNTDGTSKAGDVMHRVSTAETAIEQTSEAIGLSASGTTTVANPNLSPYFEYLPLVNKSAGSPYWHYVNGFTAMEDGWAKGVSDNSSGSSTTYINMREQAIDALKPSTVYTAMLEVRNYSGSGTTSWVVPHRTNSGQVSSFVAAKSVAINKNGVYRLEITTLSDLSNVNEGCSAYIQINAGAKISFECRMSLYEGTYRGPWKPYSGSQLYASQAELKVQSDRIGMVVSNPDASSSLALTADAMEYIGDHVEIKGSDGTSTVISGGKLQTNQITVGSLKDGSSYSTTTQMNEAIGNAVDAIEVGGRNLLLWTGENESYSSHASADRAWEYTTIYGSLAVNENTANFTKNGSGLTNNTSGLRIMAQASSGGGASAKPGESTDYNIDIAVGDVFTFSCDVKTSGNRVALSWQYYNGSGVWNSTGIDEFVPSDADWHRYTYTFTVPSNFVCLTALGIYCQLQEGVTLFVKNVKLERGNRATDWTPAPEDTDTAIEAASGNGYTVIWDSNYGTTYSGGEAMVTGYDPTTKTVGTGAGWVMWNGVKRTVPKKTLNPNAAYPYNIPLYLVLRLSSATATTGTVYLVWYNGGWKSGDPDASVSSAISAWTWAEATDIVLAKCVEPSGEAQFTETQIFDPPWTCKQVTSITVTAQSANANANKAAKTATNYIRADSTGIRIANADPDTATTYQHQTATETEFVVNGVSVAEFGGDGARIGDEESPHIEIESDRFSAIGTEGSSVFEVVSSGTVATKAVKFAVSPKTGYEYISRPWAGVGVKEDATSLTDGDYVIVESDEVTLPQLAAGTKIVVRYRVMYFDPLRSGRYVELAQYETIAGTSNQKSLIPPVRQVVFSVGTARSFDVFTVADRSSSEQTFKGIVYNGGTSLKVILPDLQDGGGAQLITVTDIRYYLPTDEVSYYSIGSRGSGQVDPAAMSTAVGNELISSSQSQAVFGEYNLEDAEDDYALIIGDGTSDSARSNSAVIHKNGGAYISRSMAGFVQMYAGVNLPVGWLWCNGDLVKVSDYPELYEAMGGNMHFNRYDNDIPDGYFRLPDFRGRAPIGVGLGDSSFTHRFLGEEVGSEDAIVPYHRHTLGAHTHSSPDNYFLTNASTVTRSTVTQGSGTKLTNVMRSEGATGRNGNTGAMNGTPYTSYAGSSGNATGANMQPSLAINFIICTGRTY